MWALGESILLGFRNTKRNPAKIPAALCSHRSVAEWSAHTTTTCWPQVMVNLGINLSSGWKDFRDPSRYLCVLQHGQLLLLNARNLLLVGPVDVRHLVILWPLLSAHLTAGARRFVHERTHSAGPAQLHTEIYMQYACTASYSALIDPVTLQTWRKTHSLYSDLRFRRHSRFSSWRGFRRRRRRSVLGLWGSCCLLTTSSQPSGQKLHRLNRFHNA